MYKWILITGGVHSDIGKGSLASTIGMLLDEDTSKIEYLKIEPCIEGDIDLMPNTLFGEVVNWKDKFFIDGDIARAAFYINSFTPNKDSGISLGYLLSGLTKKYLNISSFTPRLYLLRY